MKRVSIADVLNVRLTALLNVLEQKGVMTKKEFLSEWEKLENETLSENNKEED